MITFFHTKSKFAGTILEHLKYRGKIRSLWEHDQKRMFRVPRKKEEWNEIGGVGAKELWGDTDSD